MTTEQAQIIFSIDPIHWQTLCEVVKEEQSICRKILENPTNVHEVDMMYKGAISFAEQVMGYKEMAYKILHPVMDEEETNISNKGGLRK